MVVIIAILGFAVKILVAILIFGIIILVHELGHFAVAKWTGVKVNEFSIGMGPALMKFGKKETQYSLRALPIGGYCAMEGEDDESPDPRSFGSKKVWQRICIIIAGALMNLVLGFVLLVVIFGFCMVPDANGAVKFTSTTIAQFDQNATSEASGLEVGDQIVRVNGKSVVTATDLSMLLQSDEDGVMDMVVVRNVDGVNKKVDLPNVTFQIQKKDGGKQVLIYDFKVKGIDRTPLTTVTEAGKMEYSVGTLIWRSLGDIVTGKYGLNELSGPVGTVSAIGDVVGQVTQQQDIRDGLYTLFMMVVLITVNVGIFNLLPLPALDGGRLMFLIYEGIFRHPVKPKYEGMVHAIGMALLLLLMLVVTFSDILKLIHGGQ